MTEAAWVPGVGSIEDRVTDPQKRGALLTRLGALTVEDRDAILGLLVQHEADMMVRTQAAEAGETTNLPAVTRWASNDTDQEFDEVAYINTSLQRFLDILLDAATGEDVTKLPSIATAIRKKRLSDFPYELLGDLDSHHAGSLLLLLGEVGELSKDKEERLGYVVDHLITNGVVGILQEAHWSNPPYVDLLCKTLQEIDRRNPNHITTLNRILDAATSADVAAWLAVAEPRERDIAFAPPLMTGGVSEHVRVAVNSSTILRNFHSARKATLDRLRAQQPQTQKKLQKFRRRENSVSPTDTPHPSNGVTHH
jgi:hypothetical protein